MSEPITISFVAIAIADFVGHSIGSHILGGEAHHFYREFLERWRESPIDHATGLPRNHDLQTASLASLRDAAKVLVLEVAGRIEPKKPWLRRIIEHVREGKLFRVPLIEAGDDPRRKWVEALRAAVEGESFAKLHDKLLLTEDDVRQCFATGDLCAAFGPKLSENFLQWARREVRSDVEPRDKDPDKLENERADFETLVRRGWTLGGGHDNPATLAHAYCLFFREHLKGNPKVFRILVADTLNAVHGKLDALGTNVTAELKNLREKIATIAPRNFAALKLDFSAFEQWLEPQLGEIKNLLGDVKAQLDALASGQDELADKQGEILVAIVTLNTEVRRGTADAAAQFDLLIAWLDERHAEQMAAHAETHAGIRGLSAEFKGALAALEEKLKAQGRKLADLSVEELEQELAGRVPGLTRDDLHRLISYARLKADISRILKYAPEKLIGRESDLSVLSVAWEKVVRGEPKRPRLLTFVALGGEGKTSLVAKWAAELAGQDWPGCDAAFAWSFYSQGTREQLAASSDLFLKEALTFFGDDADKEFAASPAGGFEKGQRLARLVGQRRSLLILDGLEPLQYAPTSPTPGQLKDQGIAALLKGLAAASHGLCVVTTRYSLPDLRAFWQTTAHERELKRLSKEAGVALLRSFKAGTEEKPVKIRGTQAEFEQLVEDLKGHALCLTLMGSYLVRFHVGDIRKRDLVKLEKADHDHHAFHIMDAYVRSLAPTGFFAWLRRLFDSKEREAQLQGKRAVAVLRLIGLFDRPADAGCLAALRRETITGLTEPLAGLADDDWEYCLSGLEAAKLLTVNRDASRALVSLDAHPHLREYFARQLRTQQPDAWRAAHRRLYEHLCATAKEGDQPTLEDLQPLYQAVAHGCQAGLQQEAHDKVWFRHIRKGNEYYSTKKLGALGADLGAAACFFDEPWRRASPLLKENDQSVMLNFAAFCLRALGRLNESLEPMRISGEMDVKVKEWDGAARSYSNLSELELTLGEVAGAVGDAEQSVTYAGRSGDADWPRLSRTTHADALHQAGRRAEAETRFREAEQMQAERQPDYPLLYSVQGFRYCDLLLAAPERAAWQICMGSAGFQPAVSGILPETRERAAAGNAPESRSDASSRAAQDARRSGQDARAPLLESCRAVSQRGKKLFEWRVPGDPLLDIALDHLTLGRAALYAAILESGPHSPLCGPLEGMSRTGDCAGHLDAAVAGLRCAGSQDHIPRGLLTRAWLRFLTGTRTGPESAQEDLDEAWEIAERGPMRLFMADIHLYRARLFGRLNSDGGVQNEEIAYPWNQNPDGTSRGPKDDLAAARKLIEQCGYGRQREEFEDAERR